MYKKKKLSSWLLKKKKRKKKNWETESSKTINILDRMKYKLLI